ncbi:hypothetical protein NX059_002515 [Plenodomus lindquistii]|nr:hypothetical protein NX059_002515 [Plenodomus lindquistii]
MSSNVIPTSVAANGPQFQAFPNEILLEILKYYLILAPGTKTGTVVEATQFPFLFALGIFGRTRRISKTFNDLATMAFYMGNEFKFTTGNMFKPDMLLKFNASGLVLPALLPPLAMRTYLRHITIDIILQDFFETDYPVGVTVPRRAGLRALNPIVSVAQLFEHSPAARQLRDLTTHMRHLEVLNLNIVTDFRLGNMAVACRVLKAAGFRVKAGRVEVVVKDRMGESQEWHEEVVEAITVE